MWPHKENLKLYFYHFLEYKDDFARISFIGSVEMVMNSFISLLLISSNHTDI